MGGSGAFLLSAGPLDAGPHQAWVTAANGTGAAGAASSPVAVRIDTTPPVVSNVALAPPDLSPNGDGVHDSAAFRFTLPLADPALTAQLPRDIQEESA